MADSIRGLHSLLELLERLPLHPQQAAASCRAGAGAGREQERVTDHTSAGSCPGMPPSTSGGSHLRHARVRGLGVSGS